MKNSRCGLRSLDRDLRKAIPKVRKELKEAEAELLTDSEEVTVDWRNKHLRTIIVLANKPLTKGSSLRDFASVTTVTCWPFLCGRG